MNRRNDWKKSSRACLLVGVFALLITSGRLSAAEGPPEIAATSPVIQPYGPFIVYGDGFDRDGVECGLLYRDRAVDNAAGTNELRAWLSEAMAGRVKLPEAGWLWRAPLAREKHRVMVNSEPLPRPDDKDMPEYEKDRRSLGVLNPGAAGPLGLRVRAVGSVSVDFIANQPEIWACSPRRPVTGEVCQFWGINLGGKAALVDEKGAIAGMADAVQGYHEHSARVEARFFRGFVVPEDIKPGKYRLYNWAGLGAAGWSAPLEVEVVNPKPLPKNQVNVREVGALGDGLNDDTAIFDKAISMVANTGGRIFIPPGRYRITRWLCLPQNVELCGVSPESTILVVSMTDEGGPFETRGQGRFRKAGTLGGSGASPVIWLKSGGVLRDLTIDGSGAGVQQSFALVLVGENGVTCRDAAIINCRLVYNKPYQIPCAGIIVAGGPGPQAGKAGVTSDALRVEDCKFSVNSLCLQYIKDGRHIGASIRRNFFTTIPPHGAAELICPNGTEGCLYEANIFENGGRTKTEQCSRPSSGNATVQHNCWRLNIIRNGRKGDGETIMYETGSAGWYGKAKGATADTLTALDTDRWWPAPDKKGAWQTNEFAGGYCVIVEGRGLGQWAFIESNTADTLKLDRPWKLVPDAGATFSVLGDGSVENVHVGNDVLFTAGYSGNYRTSLRNIWAQNESDGHAIGLMFWNTGSPTFVTAFNVALGERYHERGGLIIRNDMKFYPEQKKRGEPGAVDPDDPWHKEWLAAFKNSRRVFGNEIRGCIVNERKIAWGQNGGLWSGSARMRLEKYGWRPDLLAGISLFTGMGWPGVPDRTELAQLPKTALSWNLVYDNLLAKCPVGISVSPASTKNFIIGNTFLACAKPVLDLGEGNYVTNSLVVPEDKQGESEAGMIEVGDHPH